MGRMLIGIVLASVAMFAFGFAYWGATSLPYSSWKETRDEAGAQAALRSHFPEEGTYFVPSMFQDQEVLEERYKDGPVAMIHLTSTGGGSPHDFTIMIKGVVLNLILVTVLALLYRQALPASRSYLSGITLALLVGLVSALLVDMGDAVWWMHSMEWKLTKAGYHIGAVLVAGLILTKFAKPAPAK